MGEEVQVVFLDNWTLGRRVGGDRFKDCSNEKIGGGDGEGGRLEFAKFDREVHEICELVTKAKTY